MNDFFGIILIREIVRFCGINVRYLVLNKILGKKRSWKSLSNISENEYVDMNNSLSQDFYNTLVGTIVFIIFTLIIVGLVYG